MLDAEKFWRDGYAVVRGAFDPSQVSRWREAAFASRESEADLLSHGVLREVVLSPQLIALAAAVLGDRPVYFGDSSATFGAPPNPSFHKDNTDRYDGAAPDWAVERYPIVRFGIYTQKHGDKPGGIDLRRGSHMHPDTVTGEHVSPPTSPGDVILWTLRTTHSANSRIVRGLNHRVLPNGLLWRLFARLPLDWILANHDQERLAFFVSYGRADPLFTRHVEYLKTRTYAVESARACRWDDETIRLAEERGLALVLPEERLAGVGLTHEEYQPYPY